MAKKEKLESEVPDFDRDSDFPSFDFDVPEEKDDRSPTMKFAAGILKGAKSRLTNTDTIEDLTKRALPRQFGEAYDEVADLGGSLRDTFREAAQEVKPAVHDMAVQLDKMIPAEAKRTRKVMQKIMSWSAPEEGWNAMSVEQQRQQNMSIEMARIFQEDAKLTQEQRTEDKAKERLQDAVENIRHRNEMSALNAIALATNTLQRYTTSVTSQWQRKSLELQYRSLYVQMDIRDDARKLFALNKAQGQVLMKNTALPDFVKTRLSERAGEMLRNRFLSGVGSAIKGGAGSLFPGNKEIIAEMKENAQTMIRDIAFGVTQGLSSMSMVADMNSSMDELMGRESDTIGETGKFFGDFVTETLGGSLADRSRDAITKNKKWMKIFNKIGIFQKDGLARLQEYLNTDEGYDEMGNHNEGFVMRLIKAMGSDLIPHVGGDTRMQHDELRKLRDPMSYNTQANKSITEIIPGYLSKILHEIYMLRTGDTNATPLEYDYKKNKFASYKELKRDAAETMAPESWTRGFTRNVEQQFKSLDPQGKLTDEQRALVTEFMLRSSVNNESLGAKRLSNVETFQRGNTAAHAEALASFFASYLESDDEGNATPGEVNSAKELNLINFGKGMTRNISDTRGSAQAMINAGQANLLKELGFLREDGNFNMDKLIEVYSNEKKWQEEKKGLDDSDMFLKDSITKIDPKAALNGIKQTAVSAWKYRKGVKPEEEGRFHLGPMAQDIRRYLGDKFAPGGKKIDLVSMNGATMAAAQELDRKQHEQAQSIENIEKAMEGEGKTNSPAGSFRENMLKLTEAISQQTLQTAQRLEELLTKGINVNGVGPATVGAGAGPAGGSGFSTDQFGEMLDKVFQRFGMGGAPGESFVEGDLQQGTEKGRAGHARDAVGSLFSLGKMFAKDAGRFGKKALRQGPRRARGLFSGARRYATEFGKPILEEMQRLNRMGLEKASQLREQADIYIRGEVTPRLTAARMDAQKYIDVNTGKIIEKLSDITGDIRDIDTDEIVATAAELKRSFVKNPFVNKLMEGAKHFGSFLGDQLKKGPGRAQSFINTVRRGAGWVGDKANELLDPPRDVYVKGESLPKLTGVKMRLGHYAHRDNPGTPIMRPSKIEGVVIDTSSNGDIVLTEEDLQKGLVDVHGNKLYSPVKRIGGVVAGAARASYNLIRNVLSKGMERSGKFTTGLMDSGRDTIEGFLAAMNGGFGKEGLDVLTEIRNILDERLPQNRRLRGDRDGNGYRDNSWQEKMFGGAANDDKMGSDESGDDRGSPEVRKYETKNTFSLIGEKIGEMKDKVMDMFDRASDVDIDLDRDGKDGKRRRRPRRRGKLGRAVDAVKGGAERLGKTRAGQAAGRVATQAATSARGAAMALPGAATVATTASKATGMLGSIGSGAAGLFGGLGRVGAGLGGPLLGAALRILGPVGLAYTVGSMGVDAFKAFKKGDIQGVGDVLNAINPVSMLTKPITDYVKSWREERDSKTIPQDQKRSFGGKLWDDTKSVSKSAWKKGKKAIGDALTSPWMGPVGLAGWGLKKAYDWATKTDTRHFTILRMVQYGTGVADMEFHQKLFQLEKLLRKHVSLSEQGTGTIDTSKVDPEELYGIFGVTSDQSEMVGRIANWLENRFKPVFLTYIAAAKSLGIKGELDNANKVNAETKLKYLSLVENAGSPWTNMTSPFNNARRLVVGKAEVVDVVQALRTMFEKEQKEGPTLKSAVGDLSGNGPIDPALAAAMGAKVPSLVEQKSSGVNANPTGVVQQQDENMRKTMGALAPGGLILAGDPDKGNSNKTTVVSDQVGRYMRNEISALEAVRFKTYGLTKFAPNDVLAIRSLEVFVEEKIRFDRSAMNVTWSGDAAQMLDRARKFFGVAVGDLEQEARWTWWFLKRFLPTYTTYLNLIFQRTNSDKQAKAEAMLGDHQALDAANHLIAMKAPWSEKASPWKGQDSNLDTSVCTENLNFIKNAIARGKEMAEQKASSESSTQKASNSIDAKIHTAASPEMRKAMQQARANAGVNASAIGDELEEKPRSGGSGAPRMIVGSASYGGKPILADGELSTGSGADQHMTLSPGVSLDGVHPELLKLFRGMVQEYGEKTGKKVIVTDGFRTFAQQQAAYAKNPQKAAKPGTSLHEAGQAIDVDRGVLNEMDKMGLMRKYGFTRPVGGEPWHLESAGTQRDPRGFRADANAAAAAIRGAVGRGGGGWGTNPQGALGTRNPGLAKKLYEMNVSPSEPEKDKDTTGAPLASTVRTNAKENAGGPSTPSGGGMMPAAQRGFGGQLANTSTEGEAGPRSSPSGGGFMRTSGRGYGGSLGRDQLTPEQVKGAAEAYHKTPGSQGKGWNAVKDTIIEASEVVGVDPKDAATIAAIESGFNPSAKASTSSASGLFQFTKGTWSDMLSKYGNQYGIPPGTSPMDPKANALMGALYIRDNKRMLQSVKGDVNNTDVYMAHFLGPGGARQFFSAPGDANAAKMMPAAASANKSIFYANGQPRTISEVYGLMQQKTSTALSKHGVNMGGGDARASFPGSSSTGASSGGFMTASYKEGTGGGSMQAVLRENLQAPAAQVGARSEPAAPPAPRVSTRDVLAQSFAAPAAPQRQTLTNIDPTKEAIVKSTQSIENILASSLTVQEQILTAANQTVVALHSMSGAIAEGVKQKGGTPPAPAPAPAEAKPGRDTPVPKKYVVDRAPQMMKTAPVSMTHSYST